MSFRRKRFILGSWAQFLGTILGKVIVRFVFVHRRSMELKISAGALRRLRVGSLNCIERRHRDVRLVCGPYPVHDGVPRFRVARWLPVRAEHPVDRAAGPIVSQFPLACSRSRFNISIARTTRCSKAARVSTATARFLFFRHSLVINK